MAVTQKVDRAIERSILDPYEQALQVQNETAWQRRLTLATLMFALVFCALVFHAGWKEIAALEKCAAHGISSCRAIASHQINAP